MGKEFKSILHSVIVICALGLGFMAYTLLVEWRIIDLVAWSQIASLFKGLFTFYVLLIGLFIFLENKNPYKIISWLMVLIASPFIGFIAYLAFGRSFKKRKISHLKREFTTNHLAGRADVQSGLIEAVDYFNKGLVNKRLVSLLLNNSKSPFFSDNQVEVYAHGEAFFSQLLKDILNAKSHIHMQYYIIRDDDTGNMIREALIEKAQEGLEVRLIYDSVGCWKLSKKYKQSLKDAGVKTYEFLPVLFPILGRELNYRNHRKVTVIDGQVGYIGGMNIGDEYMGKHHYLGYWRDTHLRVAGEAVHGLQDSFLMDWVFVSHELLPLEDYIVDSGPQGKSLMQVASSGPDTDWEIMLQAYFTMISTAEKRIWITTPYLVPEESIMTGLKTAALSGIDVRILIPKKADHLLVYWASRANVEPLLASGCKIYLYEKGFVHSKTMIIDDQVATVGTANLDIRSLEINFEINAFLYDPQLVSRLSDDFETDLLGSEDLNLNDFINRPMWHRLMEALGRIVSPLQ